MMALGSTSKKVLTSKSRKAGEANRREGSTMSRKRNPLLLIVAVVVVLVPAACSGSAGGGSSGDVELTFWTFVDAHADFMEGQAKEYNKANSGPDITVKSTTSEYDAMHEKLLAAIQSGVGAPDIVDIEIAKFGTFTRGEVQLHDLTEIVDRHREELVEERLAPYQFDGAQYGIDYHLGAFVMYYNTEVLDEAGVDPDKIVTWDDYIEAGKKVKEETGKFMTTIESQSRFSILALMLQNGGGTYNEENELILEDPANVEAIELAQDMVYEHGIATTPPGGEHHDPNYFKKFNDGTFASVWMPQWYMIRFKDQMPDTEGKILVRPLPVFEKGGAVSTMGGGTGTAITKQIPEEELDVAMDFLEFAKLTYDAQVKIWTELGFDPYRRDVYKDPELANPDPWFSNEPVLKDLVKMFDKLEPEYTGSRYPEAIQLLNETVAFETIEKQAPPSEELAAAVEELARLEQ
jgi:arabinosaccharide transport system substrate-binding protein